MSDIKDDIARRLELAIVSKGLKMRRVSLNAGLNETYVRDVIKRGRGKFEELEKIAREIGVRWEWLKTGEGDLSEATPLMPARPPLDREALLVALDTLLAHFLDIPENPRRALAETILSIVESPPDGSFGTDRLSKIRIGISGALRIFSHRGPPRNSAD